MIGRLKMFWRCLLALASLIALLAAPAQAYACPTCKDAVETNWLLASGYNWSVIVLVSLPFILVTAIMVGAVRALNPTAYRELKRRAWEFIWPKGWLYISSSVAALALLFYVTTPADPVTRLRLPTAELESLSSANTSTPRPPLEDRVVIVTFFASWCLPCVEQMSDLAQLQQEFADERVAVVAVNAFEDYATPPGVPHLHPDGTFEFHSGAPDLPAFLEANHVIFPVVMSAPWLSDSFGGVTRLPTTFVFDPEGRLVQRYINESRGDFVRPALEDLRKDVWAASACDRASLSLLRAACVFLRDKGWRLNVENGPW